MNIKKWYWLAAAASVLVIFFIALPAKKSPQQLAGNYIDKNLTELSVLMSNAKDSLQNGIQAYNRKDYNNALAIFKNLYNNDSANADALKYEGLAYLMLIDYDNAIGSFHTLSTKTGMFSNPGLFYKALTLLKRNSAGDIDEGRKLLRNVVENKLEGETEAEKLLEKL